MGSNSRVGCFISKTGKAEIIPNSLGQKSTPSWLGVDEEGQYFVGEKARQCETFIYDIKRMLGRSYFDEDIAELRRGWSFSVTQGEEGQC